MTDQPLSPATREDVIESLSFALRYNRRGKRVHDRDILMANAAAEHLLEALTRSGFVLLKKPPLQGGSAPPPPHAYLYDPERFPPPQE